MSTERRVDPKGRVTLPKEIREQLGIEPGESVEITVDDGHVVIRHGRHHEGSFRSLRGCLTADTKREGAPEMDPLTLKDDWTNELPE
jgi:AbrB family looped-hinge helix DNA binding protein